MAAKKKINKTQFVKALPKDMTAKDVVRKAKESGITISEAYVYTIRSAASRSAAAKAPQTAKAAKAAKAPAAKKSAAKAPASLTLAPAAKSAASAPLATQSVTKAPAAKTTKAAKKSAKKSATKSTPKAAAFTHSGHQAVGTSASHASPSGTAERKFVELVADIGMRRAEIFLQQFRGQVSHIKVG